MRAANRSKEPNSMVSQQTTSSLFKCRTANHLVIRVDSERAPPHIWHNTMSMQTDYSLVKINQNASTSRCFVTPLAGHVIVSAPTSIKYVLFLSLSPFNIFSFSIAICSWDKIGSWNSSKHDKKWQERPKSICAHNLANTSCICHTKRKASFASTNKLMNIRAIQIPSHAHNLIEFLVYPSPGHMTWSLDETMLKMNSEIETKAEEKKKYQRQSRSG